MIAENDLPLAPFWVAAAARVIRSLPAGRYRAMNWLPRRGRLFWAAMPPDLGGLLFRCDLRDPLMREACLTGRYEPQETAILQALVRPGHTVVDVGANWGYFTLAFSHWTGAAGRVVSVEADPRGAATLRLNVEKNRLAQVTVIGAAASDRSGTLLVRRYGPGRHESANFGVELTGGPDDGSERMEIAARPLDQMLDEHGVGQVNVLKMDIEGAEGRALGGLARRLGSGAIDWIVLEVHPAHLRAQGESPAAVVDAVRAYGYDAWSIDHSPAVHRRAASSAIDVAALLTPLDRARDLGDWPHVLFARRGVDRRAVGIDGR